MQTRRSFLHTLGIAATGIAFAPKSSWLIPDDIVAYDGVPNLRWLLAESVALLAAELPATQFHRVAEPTRLGARGATDQLGVDMNWSEDLWKHDKNHIRAFYLRPAMAQLASEIKYRKAKTCFRLELPRGVEQCAAISAPNHGLDLRFVRAWDMGGPWTDEETGKECWTQPRWIARFDMLIA